MSWCLVDIGNSTTQWCVWNHTGYHAYHSSPTHLFSVSQLPMVPCIVASVVPDLNRLFSDRVTYFVSHTSLSDLTTLTIGVPQPAQVGADRLATALGGYYLAGKQACLIIDSGTATTLCYISDAGCYQGGAIMPGLSIAARALHDHTAKLPVAWVQPTDDYFGTTTETAIQVGLYRSAVYTLRGFIQDYKACHPNIIVIGTGTGLETMQNKLPLDYYEPHLIFQGLSRLAQAQPL